jgi:hypothetical protein
MDELHLEWEEAIIAGLTTESFEDWYSGKAADAYDRYKDRMKYGDLHEST